MNRQIAPWFVVTVYSDRYGVRVDQVQGLVYAQDAARRMREAMPDAYRMKIEQLTGHGRVVISDVSKPD